MRCPSTKGRTIPVSQVERRTRHEAEAAWTEGIEEASQAEEP